MKREGHRLGRQTVTALDRECKHLDGSIHDLLQVQRRLDDNLSQLKCLRAMNRQCAAHKTNKERKERNSSIHANGGVRALVRDYGWPLAAWYGTVWTATAVLCYGSIAVLQIDPVAQVLKPIDVRMGWTLCQRVSPAAGRWGAALVVNELLEPIRLPLVLATLQPILAANRQKSRTQSNSKT